MRPDLRNIHSIPPGKVDAAVLDKITVPDAYPHFTPFVENKTQVRMQHCNVMDMGCWACGWRRQTFKLLTRCSRRFRFSKRKLQLASVRYMMRQQQRV